MILRTVARVFAVRSCRRSRARLAAIRAVAAVVQIDPAVCPRARRPAAFFDEIARDRVAPVLRDENRQQPARQARKVSPHRDGLVEDVVRSRSTAVSAAARARRPVAVTAKQRLALPPRSGVGSANQDVT